MTNDISEETLLIKFSSMESDQLVKLRQQGDRTEMAMGVIEGILVERGVEFSDRAMSNRANVESSQYRGAGG